MDSNFARCLTLSRVSEGGFANHPNDAGGPTMKGITLAVFRRHHPRASVEALKAITDTEVARIYKIDYWDKVRGDDLPAGLDYTLFDYALNSGPGRPAKAIQRLVGATIDGAIGPKTLAAIDASLMTAPQLIHAICDERLAFMKRSKNRKTGKPLWPDFGRGWQIRVDGVRADSLALARGVPPITGARRQPDDPGVAQKPSLPPTGLSGVPLALLGLLGVAEVLLWKSIRKLDWKWQLGILVGTMAAAIGLLVWAW